MQGACSKFQGLLGKIQGLHKTHVNHGLYMVSACVIKR